MKAKIILALILVTSISAVAYAITESISPQASTLHIDYIAPTEGSDKGNTEFTLIGGGWDYADYVTDNLVFMFDAINNTGEGWHDPNATTWKDLSGNNFDMTLCNVTHVQYTEDICPTSIALPEGFWSDNHVNLSKSNDLLFKIDKTTFNNNASKLKPAGLTVEGALKATTVETGQIISAAKSSVGGAGFQFTTTPSFQTGNAGAKDRWANTRSSYSSLNMFTAFSGMFSSDTSRMNLITLLPDSTFETSPNAWLTSDGTQTGTKYTPAYQDDAPWTIGGFGNKNQYTENDQKFTGEVYSARLYSTMLTSPQRQQNLIADKARYISPPKIYIGDVQCLYLQVVSATELRCRTAAKSAGTYDVKLEYDLNGNGSIASNETVTLPNAYTYKAASLTSVSPSSGPSTGEQRIKIYGQNIPYGGFDSYIQDGLVAAWDGINNCGLGDKRHCENPGIWVDATGHGYDMNLSRRTASSSSGDETFTEVAGTPPGGMWSANHANFTTENNYLYRLPTMPEALKLQQVTVETTYLSNTNLVGMPFGATKSGTGGMAFQQATGGKMTFQTGVASGANCDGSVSWKNSISNVSNNVLTTVAGRYSNITGNVDVYAQGIDKNTINVGACKTALYQNNAPWTFGGMAHTKNKDGVLKYQGFTGEIYGARLYNRVLEDWEVLNNSQVDRMRFVSPPTVRIGTNLASDSVDCYDLIVISANEIECTTSAMTAGTKNIYLNYEDVNLVKYSGSYTVIPAASFYVSGSSPAEGPAFGIEGSRLTVTGNLLETVTSVKVGGTACTDFALSNSNKTLTCLLSAHSAGVTDVTIVAGANTVNLLGAYEYLDVTKNPVSFRVVQADGSYKLASSSSDDLNSSPEIEPGWVGINQVKVSYPSTYTLSGILDGWTADAGTADGSNTVKTLTANSLKNTDSVAALLGSLRFSGTAEGAIKVSISNNLW
jgi:hypothetical protein